MKTSSLLLLALLAAPLASLAQAKRPPAKAAAPSAADARAAIREADLRRDLMALAADHFRGREAGSLDELKASVWLADRIREAGLQPAGDDGTYYQFFYLQRLRLAKTSRLSIGPRELKLNENALVTAPITATVNAPLVFVGQGTAADLAKVDVKGKAVALQFSGTPPADLSFRRFLTATMRDRAAELGKAGAAAVLWVSDARAQGIYEHWGHTAERGRYDLPGGPNTRPVAGPPVVWLPAEALAWVQQPNQQFSCALQAETFLAPSVNIVAKVPGTDPQLKSEYVLFSGHQDHDGVRRAVAGDSIWNGADDNGTVAVALLAIGRAFRQQPGKRSALFVWHGAEERGLLGSRYFAATPTVPKASLVAVLNGDMMGRNRPDSAALLGRRPPHRNSQELVSLALAANQAGPKFKLDTLWDKPTHPEGWYFRSDHLPYARAGIPALFYTTLLHPDYHTPKDEPDRIDYPKLAGMTRWMYLTGWAVANRPQRPALEPGFKLER